MMTNHMYDVRDNKLKTSLEKSEHYYANKALILNR